MRKLTEADRSALLHYVGAEPEMNLFFLGDVENFGLEGDFVTVYAQEAPNEWDSVLLRYYDYYLFYSKKPDFALEPVLAELSGRKVDCLSGKLALIERFAPHFPGFQLRPTYMSRCRAAVDFPLPEGTELRALSGTEEELEAMQNLYLRIDEFTASYTTPEKVAEQKNQMRKNFCSGSIGTGLYVNGALAACAYTSADNSESAMILAVATAPEYRRRGFAGAVVSDLCRRLFAEGKHFVCLFYDNPEAGRVYRKAGFSELGGYAMLQEL